MMVSELESSGGISTETPVVSRISCRVLPFGPMMYLCWDFFTSTEMVVVFRFCEGGQFVLNRERRAGRETGSDRRTDDEAGSELWLTAKLKNTTFVVIFTQVPN